MPDILIDVTRLLDRGMQGRLPTGVDRVSLEYVRHFRARSLALVRFAGQWLELPAAASERIFETLLAPGRSFRSTVRWVVGKAMAHRVRRKLPQGRFLFNTGHSGLDSAEYVRRVKRSQFHPIFFVHDLIPLTHPEYCRSGEHKRHTARMMTVLEIGHGVIANSAVTRDELADYARAQGRPMPPAVVAHLAPGRLPTPAADALLAEPYFVMLGTIEPRKNHWFMLQLWRQIVEQFGNAAPKLVVIGQRGWECENVVDLLERCGALKGQVHEISDCSDADLSTWLSGARALLFPSFVEGFGMPLIEALAMGVPVIASDLPVFREVAGNIPEYVNPLDGVRWRDLVVEYSRSDSAARRNQLERMRGYAPPTWTAHFNQVEMLMERLSFERCQCLE